jgi:hypothetical protein
MDSRFKAMASFFKAMDSGFKSGGVAPVKNNVF